MVPILAAEPRFSRFGELCSSRSCLYGNLAERNISLHSRRHYPASFLLATDPPPGHSLSLVKLEPHSLRLRFQEPKSPPTVKALHLPDASAPTCHSGDKHVEIAPVPYPGALHKFFPFGPESRIPKIVTIAPRVNSGWPCCRVSGLASASGSKRTQDHESACCCCRLKAMTSTLLLGAMLGTTILEPSLGFRALGEGLAPNPQTTSVDSKPP